MRRGGTDAGACSAPPSLLSPSDARLSRVKAPSRPIRPQIRITTHVDPLIEQQLSHSVAEVRQLRRNKEDALRQAQVWGGAYWHHTVFDWSLTTFTCSFLNRPERAA